MKTFLTAITLVVAIGSFAQAQPQEMQKVTGSKIKVAATGRFINKNFSSPSMAQMLRGGGQEGNGGDICELRFNTVRDDVASWIKKGGSAGLELPQDTSLDHYNRQMLEQISKARVNCIKGTIMIGSTEKTCKNYLDQSGNPKITCNLSRFMGLSESDQYQLVHHEYAGLAGFEKNDNEESRYQISMQITNYLEDQVVKKLVVKPTSLAPQQCQSKSACIGEYSGKKVIYDFASNHWLGTMSMGITTYNGLKKAYSVSVNFDLKTFGGQRNETSLETIDFPPMNQIRMRLKNCPQSDREDLVINEITFSTCRVLEANEDGKVTTYWFGLAGTGLIKREIFDGSNIERVTFRESNIIW